MSEHYTGRRINVRAIIYQDGKLLAVKHRSSDGSASQYYAVPGGGLDPKESLVDGAKREIIEELGVVPQIGKLLFIQQFPSKRKGYAEELEFFYEVTNPHDFTAIDLAGTTHGLEELAVCEFIDPKQELLYPAFLRTTDIANYLAYDHPTYAIDNLGETSVE